MAGQVKPIPDGFHSVTPHIILKDARSAIDFYKKAFGAEEVCVMTMPDGKGVMHAEIKIGDSIIMMGEEMPGCEQGAKAPTTLKGTVLSIHLYVQDVDAAFKKAVAAGGIPAMEPTDMFWGDRYGMVVDPQGHQWSLATHIADPTPEEMAEAAKACFAQMGQG